MKTHGTIVPLGDTHATLHDGPPARWTTVNLALLDRLDRLDEEAREKSSGVEVVCQPGKQGKSGAGTSETEGKCAKD